jgi:hypothetical protein
MMGTWNASIIHNMDLIIYISYNLHLIWFFQHGTGLNTRNIHDSMQCNFFLNWYSGGGVQLGPLGTAATNRPIVPAPGDYDDGEIGGMNGRVNRSTRRKPAPVPLCPPQTPHAARTRTRAAAVGSQRLTTSATARPPCNVTSLLLTNVDKNIVWLYAE